MEVFSKDIYDSTGSNY